MTASATVSISVTVADLGETAIILTKDFTATAPDAGIRIPSYQLAVADEDEALDLGDISTVEGVLIIATSLALDIDCNYSSSFSADIQLAEGQAAYFKPEGVVRVLNGTGAEQPTFEYLVFGTR